EAVAGEGTEVLTAALDVTMDEHAKLVSRLESGDLDLALLVSTDIDRTWIPATLSADHLYSKELFLCAPKSICPIAVDAHGLPELTALVSQNWTFSIDPGDAIDEVVRSFCLAAGFEPRVGMRMDDYAAINRMISAGLAVAMIPESSLSTDPDIEVIPMPLSACRRDVLLVSRSQRPSSSDSRTRHDPIVAAHDSAIAEVVASAAPATRCGRCRCAPGITLRLWSLHGGEFADFPDSPRWSDHNRGLLARSTAAGRGQAGRSPGQQGRPEGPAAGGSE